MNKSNQTSRFNLLIDTCVWLDLAKDHQQQSILTALEDLIRQGDIALILTTTQLLALHAKLTDELPDTWHYAELQ